MFYQKIIKIIPTKHQTNDKRGADTVQTNKGNNYIDQNEFLIDKN